MSKIETYVFSLLFFSFFFFFDCRILRLGITFDSFVSPSLPASCNDNDDSIINYRVNSIVMKKVDEHTAKVTHSSRYRVVWIDRRIDGKFVRSIGPTCLLRGLSR